MIEVNQLTKTYGSRIAIDQLSFQIQKGEIVGFLGPNGAGKSTTMKILTGFIPATSGTAKVAGYDVFDQALDVKKNVGYLPETPPVYTEMQVEDYLTFAAKLHGILKVDISKRVSWAMDRTGIGNVRGRLIGNLSKGYRQRVGLAQALLHNPQVIVLDEPTVGLDPKQIIEIRELIKSLAEEHTVILSSHILPEVTATCRRVIIINQGRIVAQDTIANLTSGANRGTIYSLTVRHPDSKGVSTLKAIDGVVSVSAAGPKLVVELKDSNDDIALKVTETAVQTGMGVLEFTSNKVNLEEIYLKLISSDTQPNLEPMS